MLGFSDFWVIFYVGCLYYSVLYCVGICIFECCDVLFYVKIVVIDGVWFSVGLINLDWCSFVYNYEVDLLVFDCCFVGELEELFWLD